MDLGLTDKVAIITGGSEGIGKYAALRMAEEGARVVIVARRPDVLEEAAQDIRTATEGVVLPVPGDVSHPETSGRVVQAALDHYGRVDILVNNAGISMAKPFEDVSDEDWDSDFELKVWRAARFIRAVIPEMRKIGGGRIINVTNLGGANPRGFLHAHLHLPGRRYRHHERTVQRPGQRQYPGQHGLHRSYQERPARAAFPAAEASQSQLDYRGVLRPDSPSQGCSLGPGGGNPRGRRRHSLPRLRAGQLPQRRCYQHR